MTSDLQTKIDMDRMYKWTRHVYDASRKYYLLGRDRLIESLKPKDGEHICELGCGTARNLVKLAKKYPKAHFYGLDASDEMLKTARRNLEKYSPPTLCASPPPAGGIRGGDITLAQGFAQNFDPKATFGLEGDFAKIVFSYSLSIIPPWIESVDHALELLPPGGEMHIVDFGSMDGQPQWFRKLIFWWLSLFHVYHKPEILNYLQRLQEEDKGTLEVQHLYKGYAYLAVFKKV